MHKLWKAAYIAAGLLALAGCAPSAPDAGSKADEEALRKGTEAWISAYSKGDIDALLALYADDAVAMPPGAPIVATREGLQDYFTTDIATSAGTVVELGPSAAGVSGRYGWHAGAFLIKDTSGNKVNAGKYLEVWRKQGDQWRLLRVSWNFDAPPASAGVPAAVPPAS